MLPTLAPKSISATLSSRCLSVRPVFLVSGGYPLPLGEESGVGVRVPRRFQSPLAATVLRVSWQRFPGLAMFLCLSCCFFPRVPLLFPCQLRRQSVLLPISAPSDSLAFWDGNLTPGMLHRSYISATLFWKLPRSLASWMYANKIASFCLPLHLVVKISVLPRDWQP